MPEAESCGPSLAAPGQSLHGRENPWRAKRAKLVQTCPGSARSTRAGQQAVPMGRQAIGQAGRSGTGPWRLSHGRHDRAGPAPLGRALPYLAVPTGA